MAQDATNAEQPVMSTLDDGTAEEISMEDVLGAGTRKKAVAAEDNVGEVPEVETQAF